MSNRIDRARQYGPLLQFAADGIPLSKIAPLVGLSRFQTADALRLWNYHENTGDFPKKLPSAQELYEMNDLTAPEEFCLPIRRTRTGVTMEDGKLVAVFSAFTCYIENTVETLHDAYAWCCTAEALYVPPQRLAVKTDLSGGRSVAEAMGGTRLCAMTAALPHTLAYDMTE